MHHLAKAMLLGALIQGLLSLGISLRPPYPGEALALRWVRVLAEHPLRGSLALGLIYVACFHSSQPGRAAESGISGPGKRAIE